MDAHQTLRARRTTRSVVARQTDCPTLVIEAPAEEEPPEEEPTPEPTPTPEDDNRGLLLLAIAIVAALLGGFY